MNFFTSKQLTTALAIILVIIVAFLGYKSCTPERELSSFGETELTPGPVDSTPEAQVDSL